MTIDISIGTCKKQMKSNHFECEMFQHFQLCITFRRTQMAKEHIDTAAINSNTFGSRVKLFMYREGHHKYYHIHLQSSIHTQTT